MHKYDIRCDLENKIINETSVDWIKFISFKNTLIYKTVRVKKYLKLLK